MKLDSLLSISALLFSSLLVSASGGRADTTDVDVETLPDTAVIQVSTDSTRLLWKKDFGHGVILEHVMPDGRLFVATDSVGCFMLKPQSGEPEWSLPELKGMTTAKFVPIPNSPYACLLECQTTSEYSRVARTNIDHFHNSLAVIDCAAGKVLWSADKFGFASVHGFWYMPPVGGLMLYGRDTGKTTWTVAASLNSGELMWRNDSLYGPKGPELISNFPDGDDVLNGQQIPQFDTDTSMIIFMDKTAIRRINLKTGGQIWHQDVDAGNTPCALKGYASGLMTPDRQTIYFPMDENVIALRTASGKPVWDTLPDLKDRVYQMELIPQGLLLRGGGKLDKVGGHDYLMLLDTATGKKAWPEYFKKPVHLVTSNFALLDGKAFVYSRKKLWEVNPGDGSYREIANSIQFKARETSPGLEVRGDRFLITEANNLAVFDRNGLPILAVSHPTLHATFGQFMGAFALTLASSMMSAMISAAIYPGPTYYYAVPNIPYGDAAVAKVDVNYTYILTYVKDKSGSKPGLVKVNRNNGATEAAIKLGDRTPMFASDEQRSRLYFVRNDQAVECYAF